MREDGKVPTVSLEAKHEFVAMSSEDILDATLNTEEKTMASSHVITLEDCQEFDAAGLRKTYTLTTAGDINALAYGYCMTIHKSQGSEWRKVWLVLHRMHKTMLSRELLYTGMTRAKDKITVLYSGPTATGRMDSSISKCIKRAVLPGTTWRDKVEVFKGKKDVGGWHD